MLAKTALEALEGKPVLIKETHISRVLIGAERVLKLKKPVDYGFLDYTTLEKRKTACEAEVRLNSRMCSEIYLGVQPLCEQTGGATSDYGVLMKRLPAERMLDELVRRGEATEQMIDRVACRLAAFHRTACRGAAVDVYGHLETIAVNWDENFRQTEPFVGRTLSAAAFQRIRDWVGERLRADGHILESRVAAGHIVDGHGDVRCESVCVTNGICFFDCIEFNDRFRCGDVAGEIAFLAMDLDACGRPDFGYYAAERYAHWYGDTDLWRVLPLYRCYRAYVRGKVLSFRLNQPGLSEGERNTATERAQGFFELAQRYADRLSRPEVILVCGRSGTGKTTVARGIGSQLGLTLISTDAVRQQLLGERKKPAAFGEGAYRNEITVQTYDALIGAGRQTVGEQGAVILDGTFLKQQQRDQAQAMASAAGAALRIIHCMLAPEQARQRLERRAHRGEGLSDADWAVYRQQQLDPFHAADGVLELDTSVPIAQTVRNATDWLRGA